MGVYINMEMPTEGYIDVRIKCNGTASFAIADNPYFKAVEAVPVPPHGDLIDRDKLEKDIDKYIGGEESRSRFHHWVQVQRTVIPDSEEAHT